MPPYINLLHVPAQTFIVVFFLLKKIVRGEYIDYLLMQNCDASMKITQSIGCDHDQIGEAIVGHNPKILLALQMPRLLDDSKGCPKVVIITI